MHQTLAHHLAVLKQFLARSGLPVPTESIAVLEIDSNSVATSTADVVRRAVAPEAFAARFDEILAARPAWVNLSCLGLAGGWLLVGVESSRSSGAARTSINYSGPEARVLANRWQYGSAV